VSQAKTANPSLVLPEAQANYVFLTKPRASDKPDAEAAYSLTLSWPKDEVDLSDLKKAILQAARNKWGDKALDGLKKGFIASPIGDGDARESDEFAGCWTVTCRRKESLGPPGVVDASVSPIIDPNEIYSGMFCHVSVSVFGYENSGKKGVGLGLNNVQKTKDGERRSGKPDPKNEFKPLAKRAPSKATAADDSDDEAF
jgi:hypothetical protein